MERLHDPAVLALPHPIRVDVAFDELIEAAILHPFASAECRRPWFLEPTVTTEMWTPGDFNLGTLLLLLW